MPKAFPDGFHSLTPYLVLINAVEAIDFYKKAFSAKELMRMPGPDGKKIMHAQLTIGDSMLMMCDAFPEWGSPAGSATTHIYTENVDALVNQAVAAGAKVLMPPTEMFWGDRFAKISDPFGQTWSVATHTKDMTPAEMQAASVKAFSEAPCSDDKK